MNSLDTLAEWRAARDDAFQTIDFQTTDLTATGKARYYTLQAGEYCNSKKLDQCIISAGPSGAYIYPAKVRFCDNQGTATSPTIPANGKCQATLDSTHRVSGIRFPGRGGDFCRTTARDDCIRAEEPTATYPIRGPVTGSFVKTDIVSGNTYPKTANRTDCTGDRCTYNEEMTNFANWHSYYRTRLQAMKTTTSLAFSSIDSRYRVGFNVINYDGTDEYATNLSSPNKFLSIDTFSTNQKQAFYDRLFKTQPALKMKYTYPGGNPHSYTDDLHFTPLRGALSRAGKIYAHKITGISDPVEHACQANFALLTTDGYWNGNEDGIAGDQPENSAFGPYDLGNVKVGNLDVGTTVPLPLREGEVAKNTLADVAKYYFDTDLRSDTLNNCTNSVGANVCGTSTSRIKQNMTTFTLGLGINGTLLHSDDYKTATSGDYYDIKMGRGTAKWESPFNCSDYCGERIDDLWHAAVNGNGTYFSAQNPQQLVEGLSSALSEIYARSSIGSAAATSTLNPVAGNNNAFIGSYTSQAWTGNLESRNIDPDTAQISKTAKWCVEDITAEACLAPKQIFTSGTDTNKNTRYYCAPSGTTAPTPALEISGACNGTMRAKFTGTNADSRTIYTNANNALVSFTYGNLTTAQQAYFQTTYLSADGRLSQWSGYTPAQKGFAKEANLVNYLRGRAFYENKDNNATSTNRVFRGRDAILGDITESAAVFVGAPNFNYLENSYGAFKTAKATRTKSVYVGANDGMLHAFNADDGTERWAFVPSMLLSKLWNLADERYASNHQNFVNGATTVSDVCSGACSSASDWKTILVGGLGQGGQGFYALDVTNDQPLLLWEFDTQDAADLGYSFGNPVITKQRDGTWVVLLTSGYNNTDGKGHLYVLNASSGALIRKISTTVGSAIAQVGLAKISAFVARPSENNQADYVYGGDLLGNLWRFKIDTAGNAGTDDTANPLLMARLTGPSGMAQAMTARPELGKINGKTVVFIGTGKYLEKTDLTSTQKQTLYAIKDSSMTLNRSDLELRTISSEIGSDMRTGSFQENAFENRNGWFVDLPDLRERQIVSAKLASGTLVVPTMVPSGNECSQNGYGWINYFEARTGGIVSTTIANRVGTKTAAAPVGINLLYIDGKPILNFTGDNDPTPQLDPNAPFKTGGGFAGKRASWRELIR
jgi:type IV pilus assembly protein PilY1